MHANKDCLRDFLTQRQLLPKAPAYPTCEECSCGQVIHNLSAPIYDGNSLLLWICRFYTGDDLIEIVDFLCRHGANANDVCNRCHGNALIEFLRRYTKDPETVPYYTLMRLTKILITYEMDINHKDKSNQCVVTYICSLASSFTWSKLLPLLEMLIDGGLQLPVGPTRPGSQSHPYIEFLNEIKLDKFQDSLDGDALVELVCLLLNKGLNVNSVDSKGRNFPMLLASRWCYQQALPWGLKVITYLVAEGVNVHHIDKDGNNLLHHVLMNRGTFRYDFLPLVNFLLDKGFTVKHKNRKYDKAPLLTLITYTPSSLITHSVTIATIDALVQRGAKTWVHDSNGENMVMKLCRRPDIKLSDAFAIIQILVSKYSVPVRTAKMDSLVVFLAARLGAASPEAGNRYQLISIRDEQIYYDMIKLFIDYGSDVNSRYLDQTSSLQFVCRCYDGNNIAGLIRLLCDAGADVKQKYRMGAKKLSFKEMLKSRDSLFGNANELCRILDEYKSSRLKRASRKVKRIMRRKANSIFD